MSRTGRIVIVGAFLGLAAIGAVLVLTEAPSEPHQVACGRFGRDNPLGGGVRMALSQAEAAFPPPIFRPQTRVASDETITDLWVRPGRGGEVYIVYASGMVVIVEPSKRPVWQHARAEIADGVPGELLDIRGVEAFVIPADPPCFGGNTVFNLRGAEIAIIGDVDLPFVTVRKAAESVIDTSPAVASADAAAEVAA